MYALPDPASRRRVFTLAASLGAFLAVAAHADQAVAEPRVVASILPVQSLVAGVMAGVGEPHLIVRGAGSPHTYALRPSDARALERAELVFWIGPVYETFLDRPLKGLRHARVVALVDAPGIVRLPAREGGPWADHDHDHRPAKAEEIDGHLFLDPTNAGTLVGAIAAALARADPANSAHYQMNAARVIARLDELDKELKAALDPWRGRPFLVFHDAYQYLEARYGLSAVGSITVSPDRRPGAKRLSQLRRRIVETNAGCVFSEPQFEPTLVRTLIEGTGARTGVLDPLGVGEMPGPEAYFTMMRKLARAVAGCLAG